MEKAQIIAFLINFIVVFSRIFFYAVLLRVIMSWFTMGQHGGHGRFTQFLNDITDPIINLAKKLPHQIGILDLSPIMALFGVDLLSRLLIYLLLRI